MSEKCMSVRSVSCQEVKQHFGMRSPHQRFLRSYSAWLAPLDAAIALPVDIESSHLHEIVALFLVLISFTIIAATQVQGF